MGTMSASGNNDAVGTWGILFYLTLFILVIVIIYRIIHRTVEFTSDAIEFVGEIIEAVVYCVIDLFTINQEVKQRVPNAFKILVQEKEKTAIKVGIFDNRETPLQQMEITSNEGVSDELIVGNEYILS